MSVAPLRCRLIHVAFLALFFGVVCSPARADSCNNTLAALMSAGGCTAGNLQFSGFGYSSDGFRSSDNPIEFMLDGPEASAIGVSETAAGGVVSLTFTAQIPPVAAESTAAPPNPAAFSAFLEASTGASITALDGNGIIGESISCQIAVSGPGGGPPATEADGGCSGFVVPPDITMQSSVSHVLAGVGTNWLGPSSISCGSDTFPCELAQGDTGLYLFQLRAEGNDTASWSSTTFTFYTEPEPGTWLLLVSGLLAFALKRQRSSRRSALQRAGAAT